MRKQCVVVVLLCCLSSFVLAQGSKPKISLDEFFNYVSFNSVSLSPDGNSVLINTNRADWDQEIFRKDLWLYRISPSGGSLVSLTHSGHDSRPQWSPDGQWIGFLSERKVSAGKSGEAGDEKEKEISQLFVISGFGGEAIPVTNAGDDVHAFAWSSDSKQLYFATRQPWSKQQSDEHKKEWKDSVLYRSDERGDQVFQIAVSDALARSAALGSQPVAEKERDANLTAGSKSIGKTQWHIQQLVTSRDGKRLAFVTTSVSERQEKPAEFEVFVIDLANASAEVAPKQVTHNEAFEAHIGWARDNRHLFFTVEQGSVEGKYSDSQPRLYVVDTDTSEVQRWAAEFPGEIVDYAIQPDGTLAVSARLGTEVQMYTLADGKAQLSKRNGWPGYYSNLSSAEKSPRFVFVHSSLQQPQEVYVAESLDKLSQARPVTAFNQLFTQRDLPQGKPYQWKSDDGTPVEGMLMYPPGKFEAKGLPMLVLIHGGPADADGNHFECDWYQWDRLAASNGWLVFEPNYRGSTGYGDAFLRGIVPEIVSRPGKDILAGVDSLVKDGIADPDHLVVGGYSYGGYMTNWLITQTTRFKAAVTGAGAVEHLANWGNDDMTVDDAYFLGGRPWEVPDRYRSEAAIFQIEKVRTPTHEVAGTDDIRVAVLENYLLDHALQSLNIAHELVLFPGEGHSLSKNPWHGKIKVREELKWLQKYGGVPAQQ
ncbi:MAG: S9 family peptidase [Terriglobales bacterium]